MLNKDDLTNIKEYIKENKTATGINIDLNTLNKIEELLDIVSLQELPKDDKKYNIAFLHDYLNVRGITVEKFANYLGISRTHIYRVLNGDVLINSTQLNKLLELFKVESYFELQRLVKKDFAKINDNDIDMTDLKKFLKDNKITNLVFAKYLGIKKAHIYRLYNGQLELKPLYKNKINILFASDELIKELACESRSSRKHCISSEVYDISFLKDYLKDNNISQNSIAKCLGISRQYMSVILAGEETINDDKLNIILELFNVDNYDELKQLVNVQEKINTL